MKSLLERIKEHAAKLIGLKEGQPDLALLDANSAAAAAVRNVDIQIASLATWIKDAEAEAEQLQAERAKGLSDTEKTAVIDAALAAGEIVRKTDADAAAQLAMATRETELKGEFDRSRQAEAAAAAARAKLAETCKLGPAVLSAVPAELCAAADFQTGGVIKIKERLDKLAALGITAESVQAEVCALGLDAAGDDAFAAKLATYQSIADQLKGGGGSKAPFSPTPSGQPAKVMVF